jgi:hypothetical protein
MRQFGRRYQLVIGNRSDGFMFDNLRIAFDVTKSLDKNPNPAKISVWNLTKEHRGAVLSGQYKTVALSVGYEATRLIYAGDIVKRNVLRDGMDFILALECGDGSKSFTSARVNMTLPAGTTDAEAAIALAGTMPDTTRGTMAVTRTSGSARPRVYCGNSRNALSNLARANNADWCIQDGAVVMLPANAALAGEGPLISQETGMVGMPQQTDNGLEVKCLCNPAITVGGVVRVESIEPHYNGGYKVVSVQHTGDYLQGDWLSTIICIGGTFQKVHKKKAHGADGAAVIPDDDDDNTIDGDELVTNIGIEKRLPRVYSVDDLVRRRGAR